MLPAQLRSGMRVLLILDNISESACKDVIQFLLPQMVSSQVGKVKLNQP